MALVNASNGVDVWMGAKAAAARFLGARATAPGFDGPAVLAGVTTHFVISIVWGAAFGLLFAMARSVPVARAVLNHLLFGFVLGLAFVPLERRLAPGAVAPWIDTRRRPRIRAA